MAKLNRIQISKNEKNSSKFKNKTYFFDFIVRISLDLTDHISEKNESETVFLKLEANFRENQIIRSMFQPGEGWQKEEISKNWKCEGPKNPLLPGRFRI